jgi:hypothetical protein
MKPVQYIYIKAHEKDAVERAVHSLKNVLKPGDIILSGPIPKNILSKYFHITLILARRILKGVTHSCLYLGDDKILDIDYKILRSGQQIEEVTLTEFVKGKLDYFGGVLIYVVKPKHYSKIQRNMAIQESRMNFIRKSEQLSHTLWGSLVVGFRYVFQRRSRFKEDMSFRNDWTCGHMVAYIMKKSNVNIGTRASYTFVPPMFLFNKHFMTKSKIVMD